MPEIFIVEGNIGSGKSTFLSRIKEILKDDVQVIYEPLDEWLSIKDETGNEREIRGLYAALSVDDGKTWPYKRLVTDDGPARTIECTDGAAITMSGRSSEYRGYLSACQGLDGLIHVISSRNHYAFNVKWLKTLPPALVDEVIVHPPAC